MPDIDQAIITTTAEIPVQDWHYQSLIQAFAWVVDPTSKVEYLFCTQAHPSGGGKEDAYVHRHKMVGNKITYMDTMRCTDFGHIQFFHVRISDTGNPWIWSAVGRGSGSKLARYLYQPGRTINNNNKNLSWVHTPSASVVGAVGSQPFDITVRVAHKNTEDYYLCYEKDLLKGIWKPRKKFVRKKVGDTFQGSCATNGSVWTLNGHTSGRLTIRQYNWTSKCVGTFDISNLVAKVGYKGADEPEGLGLIHGVLNVGKRFSASQAARNYWLFGLHW